MRITTPADHGRTWMKTLDAPAHDGPLDSIMHVDLCNELWPPVVECGATWPGTGA